MRKTIRIIFYITCYVWILLASIIGIAWLFDSHFQNLTWLWLKVAQAVLVCFLLNLLFGENINK